jgi:glycogen(starch) synthase
LLTGPDIYTPFSGTPDERAAINARNQETLSRVLAEEQPDVVFAWNMFFLDASLLDALEHSGIRTVVMLTDNWLLVMRNPLFVHNFFQDVVFGNQPAPRPPASPPSPAFLRRIKAFFAPTTTKKGLEAIFGSAFMRDYYAAGGLSFARHKVIHNGVRQGQYAGAPPPDRRALIAPGTLRLLFAGRLVDLKGAHTAVAALPLLTPSALGVTRVTLTLLGDAQDKAYMTQLATSIAESGRAADIDMRASVPEGDLPALFNEYDIYLFPSLYEPFSLTLIHALALGIPTIASDAGGNVEIVRDGESGALFRKGDPRSLADAITGLANDGAMRARIAEGGAREAARFKFERMVSDMAAFLSPPT